MQEKEKEKETEEETENEKEKYVLYCSVEQPAGPYPTYVEQEGTGRVVPVVQVGGGGYWTVPRVP